MDDLSAPNATVTGGALQIEVPDSDMPRLLSLSPIRVALAGGMIRQQIAIAITLQLVPT